LKIPEPCAENWKKMTPTERGMFCDSCKKEIFDFTNYSNYQLSKKLDANENICGRFKTTQIDTELNSSNNFSFSRLGLLLGITSIISATQPIHSQNEKPKIEFKDKKTQLLTDTINKKSVLDTIVITGNIIDSDKYALPGAHVLLKGNHTWTETDFDGNFKLKIPTEFSKNKMVLIVSYLGFESKEIIVDRKTKILNIELKESDLLMGEVIIIKKQNIFRRIGNIFRKKENKTCN